MFKRDYVISGITTKMAEKWNGGLRKDFKLFVNEKREILGKIKLSPIEAIEARIQIRKYNLTNNSVLRLNKYEGKHSRV